MNHRYTTKTGIIVLALTILCVFAWDLSKGNSIPSAAFYAFLIGFLPITWFPAIVAMVVHERLHEKYEAKVQAAAQKMANDATAGP
ncbi:hypothetical protein ACFVTZ_13595 [Cellulosimicrobium cellulans]|uniref:hypothetical protein n=1 Tax=Cellulosimicrobium cellulans TaxID=1710 RepID=UPI0036E46257